MGQETLEQKKQLEKLEKVAEEATEPEEIQEKAEQAPDEPAVKAPRFWFVPYLILAGLCGAGILFLKWQASVFNPAMAAKANRYLLGGLGIAGVLAFARGLEVYAIARVRNAASRFNLKRILRLLLALVLAFLIISVLFVNWYTAVVSLGLISLVLGFALQTPISSLIGWVYILIRAPYRVGDRIQIGDARGDVI